MTDIGLVVFTEDNKKAAIKNEGFIKSFVHQAFPRFGKFLNRCGFYKTTFGTRLFYLFRKKYFMQPNETIKVSEDINFQIIKLPFSMTELPNYNTVFIEKIINKNLTANNIKYCHIPATVKERGYFQSLECCPSHESVLLKMLLDTVIENIFSKKAERIGDLDLLLLAGENREETYEVIRLLEPQIRYVTIAANNKEAVEEEAENIFGDSGLSISVVGDYKAALKNADLVLNFAKELPYLHKIKLKTQAIIFNLTDADLDGAFPEKTVISGLVPDLPKQLTSKLGMRIMQYYTRKELASLLIAHFSELSRDDVFSCEKSQRVKSEFGLHGFRIAGLKGRYGVLRIDALQKYAGGPAAGN